MSWSRWFELNTFDVANEAPTTGGVFCLARKESEVRYPGAPSNVVFIGSTTDRQRGVRAVLADLVAQENGAIAQQRREHGGLRFCFQANLGERAEPLQRTLLADFERTHGALPLCNPRSR